MWKLCETKFFIKLKDYYLNVIINEAPPLIF